MDNLKDIILTRGSFKKLNSMQEAMLDVAASRVILLAPTGSGKTVAFLAFLLRHLHAGAKKTQGLIIVPSRELARQVSDVFKTIASEYTCTVLYGGHSIKDEINTLKSLNPDVIISTPGRLLDHISKDNIDISSINTVVIDEMDKCLDLGFLPDIKKILKRLPRKANLVLTSATEPNDEDILKLFGNATKLDYRKEQNLPDVEIVEIPSEDKDKLETLERLLDSLPDDKLSIVFVNHRESAVRVYEHLKKDGFPVGLYHGTLEQQERETALFSFINGVTPVLISTDLGARGLDIPDVDNIIHYHIPFTAETYTHRNGRTARAGAKGNVYVIRFNDEDFPEFIHPSRQWYPTVEKQFSDRGTHLKTLIFNIGKRDKISRGDIVGFLTKTMMIPGDKIGKIMVADHYSAVVLPKDILDSLSRSISTQRIKNKRFKYIIL